MARAATDLPSAVSNSRRQLVYELVSGLSGLALALFMLGHTLLLASILFGESGFERVAVMLEEYFLAQPIVILIPLLFVLHAAAAARKIPAKLAERRRMLEVAKAMKASGRRPAGVSPADARFEPHVESLLWIWQVRTGLVMLVLGSFHLILIAVDVLTPLYGERTGLEAATTLARERAGLWIVYLPLLICTAFHTATGLYRLAVKWGVGSRLTRKTLWRLERVILFFMLGLGGLTLVVMAGLVAPPFGASP